MTLNGSGVLVLGYGTLGTSIGREIGDVSNVIRTLNDTDCRRLAGISAGTIAMNDFYGATMPPNVSLTNGTDPDFVCTNQYDGILGSPPGTTAVSCRTDFIIRAVGDIGYRYNGGNNTDGYSQGTTYNVFENWVDDTTALAAVGSDSYEYYMTKSSGDNLDGGGGTIGAWTPIPVSGEIYFQNTVLDNTDNATEVTENSYYNLTIRETDYISNSVTVNIQIRAVANLES